MDPISGGLISFLGGAITRLVPMWMDKKDKKDERRHELEMLRAQMDFETLRTKGRSELARVEAEGAIGVGEIQALIEATRAQGRPTGVPKIDALNAAIRPLVTIWWVIVLYTAVFCARLYILLEQGTPAAEALLSLWGTFEHGIVGAIIGFWFVSREIAKRGLGS